jgi:glucan phosphoethanolaminetransferase (alkaline phosphatase superfamily)
LNFFEPILKVLLLLPFALVGFIHCLIPYLLVKRFTEKSFKRPVFWGSVKMLVGMIVMGLVNIPVIFIVQSFFGSYLIGFVYYVFIGLFGLSSYHFIQEITQLKSKLYARKSNLYSLKKERIELEKMIEAIEF